MATKVTSSLIDTVSASQIVASGATSGQVLTYNGSTSTWVASATPLKAWVNFNGIGTVGTNQTIYGSSNVSSVYKNAIGDYTIRFVSNMSSTGYCVLATCNAGTPTTSNGLIIGVYAGIESLTLSSVRVSTKQPNAPTTAQDAYVACITIFG